VNQELFRHFFRRLFDSEFISNPGQLKTVFGGIVGILASMGGVLAEVFYHKYLVLQGLDSPDPFRRALLADIVFLETFVMIAIGLFTTIQWTALFPTLRDYLALAALPIRMRDIFVAKFAALSALAGGILLTLTLAPSFILSAIAKGKYLPGTFFHIPALFVSSTLAGIFVFFSLVVLEGVLLNIVPVRHFPPWRYKDCWSPCSWEVSHLFFPSPISIRMLTSGRSGSFGYRHSGLSASTR
jgi:hypothetical protein